MNDKSKIVDQKIAILRKSFAKKLPERLDKIHHHWAALQIDWQVDVFNELHREVHSLAGTSLTYGFVQPGTIARELEKVIQHLTRSRPDAEQSQEIVRLLSTLQQAVEQTEEVNEC
ncbi:MAG: hypothetical protein DRR16_26000 [Candidatus Parabeggiatoa sp. nov. 3]|nr:MAG: hypothetical protein DRR00_08135 [Gammaproteobacteria bacterium]RKZ62737.1 MAG: hypothetical protein DRQ99_18250 [Gammaproteobacteria bacterium]RKZ79294.1 MAG: hypothetical protein DRR16_26000 [Gammaproteobacteria bacterium]